MIGILSVLNNCLLENYNVIYSSYQQNNRAIMSGAYPKLAADNIRGNICISGAEKRYEAPGGKVKQKLALRGAQQGSPSRQTLRQRHRYRAVLVALALVASRCLFSSLSLSFAHRKRPQVSVMTTQGRLTVAHLTVMESVTRESNLTGVRH